MALPWFEAPNAFTATVDQSQSTLAPLRHWTPGPEDPLGEKKNGPRRLVLRPLRERVYVGGGESEAPIHDIELMPDHYAKDLAFEFLEKFVRFECGMKEARFCKRDGKEGRAGLNWEKFKVKLGPRPTEQPRLKLLFSPAVPKPRCVSFPPRLFSYAGAASHKPKVGIEHLR